MAKILSLDEFASVWQKSHPHDVVKKMKVEGVNIWANVGVFLTLIAVNILSAAHTIPVIVETVLTPYSEIKAFVAIAGFIGVEFAVFLFKVFGKESKQTNAIIAGLLTVAIVANLSSTLYSIGSSIYGGGGVAVGVILGLFAPLATLGIGDVFRHMQEERANKMIEANKDFDTRLKQRDSKIRSEYTKYLTRIGITDISEQLQYMSGEITNVDNDKSGIQVPTTFGGQSGYADSGEVRQPERKRLPVRIAKRPNKNSGQGRGRTSPLELAQRLIGDGNENMTYGEIQMQYGVSPNTIKEAKAIIEKEM